MAQIIVLSDIHGNLPALEAAWSDITRRPYDALFCLGDLAAFGPWPEESVAFVRDTIQPTAVIRGNTDRYLVEQPWKDADESSDLMAALKACREKLSDESIEYLESLPAEHTETLDDLEIELVHGGPGDDEFGIGPGMDTDKLTELFDGKGPGVTFCGHTHVPYRKRLGERMIVNDGSIGFPFDGDQRAGYVRGKIAAGRLQDFEFRRVSYNFDRTVAALQESGLALADTLIRRLRFAEM